MTDRLESHPELCVCVCVALGDVCDEFYLVFKKPKKKNLLMNVCLFLSQFFLLKLQTVTSQAHLPLIGRFLHR